MIKSNFKTDLIMKKVTIRILLVVFVLLVVLAILFGLFAYKFSSETSIMTPHETGEIVPGVFAVKDDFVNLFLVKYQDGYVAIDAGNNTETIANELQKISINQDEIKAILLTHSDADHTALARLSMEIPVHLPKNEEQLINGQTNRFAIFGNQLERSYSLLVHDQVLRFGNLTIRCVDSPGHTPGSMSFLVNNRYLFTGDSTSLIDGKIGLFNDFFNMDNDTQAKTLKELAKLNTVTHVFTAHYGSTNDASNAFSDFR